jgi:hypothetical protein
MSSNEEQTERPRYTPSVQPWASVFRDPKGGPARIAIEQTTRNEFRLLVGFRYHGKSREFVVTPQDLPTTDLTSVPGPLRWFVSRYGTHTLAALLHDHLIRNGARLDPPVDRIEADTIFREALGYLDVPPIRRTLMWAAVVFGTRWAAGGTRRAALAAWVAAAAIGTITFIATALAGNLMLSAAAFFAPLVGAALWGRQAVAGMAAGYAATWLLPPTVLGAAGYGVYWILERTTLRLFPESADTDRPTPYEEF